MGSDLIRTMTVSDHDAALALWRRTPGVSVGPDDDLAPFSSFLGRNPGLSQVAVVDGQVIGTLLAGHDGRRGYLHHLAVAVGFRRQGIARALVARCLAGLGAAGLAKCHVLVFADNSAGRACWQRLGWKCRDDLVDFSAPT